MKIKTFKGSALAMAFGTIFLSSCATILNEDTQKINVTSSNNKPFKGTIDGVPFNGPGVVSVKRTKEDKVISVPSGGCANTTSVNSEVDPKFFINILSGGTFGSTTDYSTDKMWKYQDNVIVNCQ